MLRSTSCLLPATCCFKQSNMLRATCCAGVNAALEHLPSIQWVCWLPSQTGRSHWVTRKRAREAAFCCNRSKDGAEQYRASRNTRKPTSLSLHAYTHRLITKSIRITVAQHPLHRLSGTRGRNSTWPSTRITITLYLMTEKLKPLCL